MYKVQAQNMPKEYDQSYQVITNFKRETCQEYDQSFINYEDRPEAAKIGEVCTVLTSCRWDFNANSK